MPRKTIESVDVQGKRVLIRVDFNVPVENGNITDDRRVQAALPTIRSVLDRGGSCVLMSHLGRPSGSGFEEAFSLKPVAGRLGELLGKDVVFPSNDCVDDAAKGAVDALAPSSVVLLENLRFHKAEKKGDADFAALLASYGEIYVNDAFGTCHRGDASMVAVPKAMARGPRVVGLLVDKELKYLSETLAKPKRPFCVVLGGAKVSDKLPAIDHLLPRANHIVIGGAMAYTFLKAMGRNVGESRVEEDRLADAKRILAASESDDMAQLHLPMDHVCSTSFQEHAGDIEVFADNIKDGFLGLDIGPETTAAFSKSIRLSKTIVWNGPMGVFEWVPFRMGTKLVAEAIAEATSAGATSIVGGGDSAAAVEKFGLSDQFSHVSTGGGASLEMISGKSFESVELLDDA